MVLWGRMISLISKCTSANFRKTMKNLNIKHGDITKKKTRSSMCVQVFIYASLYPNSTYFFVRAVKHVHLMPYLQTKLFWDSSEFEFMNDSVCLIFYSTKLTLVLTEWISDIWTVNKKPLWDRQWYEPVKYFIGDCKKPWDFLRVKIPNPLPQALTTENKIQ